MLNLVVIKKHKCETNKTYWYFKLEFRRAYGSATIWQEYIWKWLHIFTFEK